MNDLITDSGEAFMGQGLSSSPSVHGFVQLWNPSGSGKILYVDTLICCGEQKLVADVRKCNAPLANLFADHITNKAIDGPNSVAEIRTATGAQLTDYPYNRPVQEIWGSASNDKTFTFDPPIKVPQGRGIAFVAADSRAIASWQWREKTDPLGVVIPTPPVTTGLILGSAGTLNTTLSNGANAFDASDTTYANDAEVTTFQIGKVWTAAVELARFAMKSPTGRSFSGGSPGRVLTWRLQTYDGTTWTDGETGTFTESGPYSQQTIDVTLTTPVSALGHRVKITDTAAAAHRVATLEFYA